MSKTVPANIATHLGQEVTTLATATLVTRRDGRKFRFTSSSEDVILDFGVVLGNTESDQLFKCDAGYSRTNMRNTADLNVGDLELVGALDSAEITETDIKGGLFDFADIRIAFFNHQAPEDGIIKMVRGQFSEAKVTTQGLFQVELRDLTQVTSKRLGEFYSKECRADVGDKRCRVPVYPDLVKRSEGYALGEFVRAAETAADLTTTLTVVNPGAESGVTGWTNVAGTLATDPTANSGAAAFTGGAFTPLRAVQTITVPSAEEEFIDANQRTARLVWFGGELGGSGDRNDMAIAFFDAGGEIIGVEDNAGANVSPTYTERELLVQVPRLTRSIRLAIIMDDGGAGGTTDALIDDITLELTHDFSQCPVFNDLVYVVTTAGTTAAVQPTYNLTLGGTTTDGTVVFTSEEAWTRCFTVTQVDSARTTFQVAIADFPESGGARGGFPNAIGTDAPWFQHGAVFFEDGANIGRGTEVRDWTTDGGTGDRVIELFDPLPFDIQVGDTGRISVGCDQRLSTCRAKFDNVINFVGEPFVPGQDVFGQYPDAPA